MNNILNFLKRARRLSSIDRCSNISHIKPYSVSDHSFYIAFYSMVFADLENDRGENYDTSEVIKKALLHDIEESETGDILFPLHHAYPGFKEKLDEIRNEVVRSVVFKELPVNVRNYYNILWKGSKDFSKEGRLVACMDKFEILMYSVSEMDIGNSSMHPIYKTAKKIINEEFNIPSVHEVIASLEFIYDYE